MTAPTTPAGSPFPSDEPPSHASADIVAAYMREHGIVLTGMGYWWACKVYQAGRALALEEAAAMVEQLTYRRRLLKRAVNGSQAVDGCEYAAAIRARKGKTP